MEFIHLRFEDAIIGTGGERGFTVIKRLDRADDGMTIGELFDFSKLVRLSEGTRSNQDIGPKKLEFFRERSAVIHPLKGAGTAKSIDAALKKKGVRVVFVRE